MKELYTKPVSEVNEFSQTAMLLLHPVRVLTGASVEKTNLTL